ncbi:putative membrane protein [Dichotomicrobium thermohalophilum]|uniref:Putative membrane protein n=2 Tax=Dichotomicrobium thermohalophilum TaxID=933063 RepID=A0A397Q3S4_9HYPH|nr:putative membrane protein [Dichotomicrobium thermohalophilum]
MRPVPKATTSTKQRSPTRSSFLGRLPTMTATSVLLAAILFAASLTPSLMPRDALMQGLLGGVAAAVGYLIATELLALARYLLLPRLPNQWRTIYNWATPGLAAAIAIYGLFKANDWQNITRAAVGLAPVEETHRFQIALIALGVFLILWVLGHVFAYSTRKLSAFARTILPERIAFVAGAGVALFLFWSVIDGALVRTAFRAADASFAAAEMLIEPDIRQPQDPGKTGSPGSLVSWQELGRRGRDFIARGPTREEIAAFWPNRALEPLRVYVGRHAAGSPEARADIALEELIRVGGFDRSVLVVAIPTGTGWLDPGGHDTLEFILGGDVATVAVQYSYLTSGLALLAHPDYGIDQARTLFNAVYEHWLSLPGDARPKLYVHGLSQGAFNSQKTLPLLDMLGEPIDGGLWAGSPFFSPVWNQVRTGRNPDSPDWRPRYGNGSLFRVANQNGAGLEEASAPWGPMRFVFLNYGSDPIVAFTYGSAFQRPAWMEYPRAPDVSDELTWFPIVTMLQVALDTSIALDVPGYGHDYIARDYIDAWAAVLDPPNWSDERAAELKVIFEKRGPAR